MSKLDEECPPGPGHVPGPYSHEEGEGRWRLRSALLLAAAVAALQGRAVAVVGLLVGAGAVVHRAGTAAGSAAQARPVRIFLRVHLVAVVQHGQPALDVVEFRRVD